MPRAAAVSWANAVSLTRIPLGVAFLLTERAAPRIAILVAAAASDYLDGWIARRFRQGSRMGELLDPATDKIFVLMILAAFLENGVLAIRDVLVLLSRDLVTVAAFLVVLALRLPIRFRARFSGKVVTVLQIATICVLTIQPAAAPAAFLLTAAASLWAITDYLRFGIRSLRAAAERR